MKKDIKEEVRLLDIQMITTGLLMLSLILTIIINYNSKLLLLGQPPLFSKETSRKISIFDKSFILLLFFIYFYIDNAQKEMLLYEEHTNDQERNMNLQILASLLTIIAGIIVLYVAITDEDTIEGELNPEL